MRYHVSYFIMAIGLLFVLFTLGFAGADTIIVDDDGGWWADHDNIQDAIDNAVAGDHILVYNGTYVEKPIVDIRLTIDGNSTSDTFVVGDGMGSVISVNSGIVIISGLNISNSGTNSGDYGVDLYNVSNCSMRDLEFYDTTYGIGIDECEYITTGNISQRSGTSGFRVLDSNRITISDLKVDDSWNSIYFVRTNNSEVSNCTFNNVTDNVINLKFDCSQNNISNNVFT